LQASGGDTWQQVSSSWIQAFMMGAAMHWPLPFASGILLAVLLVACLGADRVPELGGRGLVVARDVRLPKSDAGDE